MKKLNLFLLVAGFFVFSSCTERLEHNEEKSSGNVVINLSSVNAERGAVPDGYSSFDISQVTEWELTFSPVPPFDKFPAETRTITRDSNSVTIGVGKYDLFVEGSYTEPGDNGDFTYNLSGSCSGIVVEEGKKNTVPVSVLVGPRKTTEGKGSFSAEMSFEKVALSTYYKKIGISSNDTTKISKRFKAELVSRKTGEIVYSTHSGGNLLVAVADSTDSADTGDSSVTVKSAQTESEPNKISSGYYYFRFYADFAPAKPNEPSAEITPVWKEVSIGDNLVEIGDELLTSMSRTSLSFPVDAATYCYYASDKGSKENNGISEDAPGELYAVLDTIYNNPMVQNAAINYTYPDSGKMEFDVSKVQSGKQVTINYQKYGPGDSSSFTIDEKGLTTFYNMNEELSLITTNADVKSFNVKEINSSIKVCLNNGVYLDFNSFEGNEQSNIYFDVDNVEYYKNNPMVVSSVSFNEKLFFVSSDPSNFTYDIVENSADSSYKYYAEEPVSPIVYYSNKYSQDSPVQYWIQYKENSPYGDNPPSYPNSLAAFCDDYNGGLYAFEFKLEGDTNNKVPNDLTESSGYELVHFVREKTGKPKFILNKKNTLYIKQQIPASMCTDGTRLYFVNTAATITGKGGKELSLSSWDHWAYENAIVYSVVAGNSGQSASEVQLNFDSVFTKVTAVYCQGINKDLYIAGYKTNQNGSTKDSTYCIYKLANPQNYTTSVSITVEDLTKVSELFTTSKDNSFKGWCTGRQITQKVYAFNAITDMAIIDNNLYVLKNSYYFANANNTNIASSLIRINNNGQIGKTWSTAGDNTFMVARKFIAVLPKKKKLLISENASSCYYTGDFSNDDLNIGSTTGSAYAFDGYDPNGGFMSETKFQSEADFIENVSSN